MVHKKIVFTCCSRDFPQGLFTTTVKSRYESLSRSHESQSNLNLRQFPHFWLNFSSIFRTFNVLRYFDRLLFCHELLLIFLQLTLSVSTRTSQLFDCLLETDKRFMKTIMTLQPSQATS